MEELRTDNRTNALSEAASNSQFNFSLEGWPAALAIISFPAAMVIIHAIDSLANKKELCASDTFGSCPNQRGVVINHSPICSNSLE